MFHALLQSSADEARREAKQMSFKPTPERVAPLDSPAAGAGAAEAKDVSSLSSAAKKIVSWDSDEEEGGGSGPAGILYKLSEWLFDVFDANCMPEYKLLRQFEARACRAFVGDEEEFTFEQEALHREFAQLFEGLIEGYINEQGFSIEQFYEEVDRASARRPDRRQRPEPTAFEEEDSDEEATQAIEILDVCMAVTDFTLWAQEMRELVRLQNSLD